jgi:long-chain acyl-CoA synthetase
MGSVGQPLKGVQIKIIDPQRAEGMPYPVGEIAISGDIIMKGYYNRAEASAETIRDQSVTKPGGPK